MNTRASDPPNTIRVSRDIPLPWLISMLIAISTGGVVFWSSVRDLARATEANTAVTTILAQDLKGLRDVDLKGLANQLNERAVKDATRDAQIQSLVAQLQSIDRRLIVVEQKVK